jgi:hypothetical protein
MFLKLGTSTDKSNKDSENKALVASTVRPGAMAMGAATEGVPTALFHRKEESGAPDSTDLVDRKDREVTEDSSFNSLK